MKQQLAKVIPNFLKPALRKIYHLNLATSLIDGWRTRYGMIPPASMIFVGSGDFRQIGRVFRDYFIELGDLQPGDRVLDIGCGIGRMAIPLTKYLSKNGEYWGIDIVKHGIDWCQE